MRTASSRTWPIVAQSLAANTVTGQVAAEQAMQGALGRLFAVAEAYPELKADANFRQLQTELEQIEDQLQLARRYYNAALLQRGGTRDEHARSVLSRQPGRRAVRLHLGKLFRVGR